MNYSLKNKKTDDGFFNKVVMALHQNNLLTNLFRPTRHPERSGATHVGTFDNNRHAAFTLAEGATQRICTRVSEAKLVPKTTLLRAVQIQDRRYIRVCISSNVGKILRKTGHFSQNQRFWKK